MAAVGISRSTPWQLTGDCGVVDWLARALGGGSRRPVNLVFSFPLLQPRRAAGLADDRRAMDDEAAAADAAPDHYPPVLRRTVRETFGTVNPSIIPYWASA